MCVYLILILLANFQWTTSNFIDTMVRPLNIKTDINLNM